MEWDSVLDGSLPWSEKTHWSVGKYFNIIIIHLYGLNLPSRILLEAKFSHFAQEDQESVMKGKYISHGS